jgi:hypothetical protein
MRTTKWTFRVERKAIHYLRTTLESYDGMAVVRTLEPAEALIQVLVSPGCEKTVAELLEMLRGEEGMQIRPRP